MTNLPDIQNSCPEIQVKLHRVGVQDFKLPIKIIQQDGGYQSSVATIDCFVDLSCDNRGVNMSRIPLVLHEYLDKLINQKLLGEIAATVRNKCEAETCQLIYKFPYFIKKKAPISGQEGIVFYNVTFDMTDILNKQIFRFGVDVHATSLCPCSREISESGAHNQRCEIKLDITPNNETWIWLEDLIRIAEDSASCEIYSVLKRPDEKYVTENAYKNAAFCEDITRKVYDKLSNFKGIEHFNVEVISDESIHQHKAYARLNT
jgi:GTP cyclohydrolase I